jgi:hypothetical protein
MSLPMIKRMRGVAQKDVYAYTSMVNALYLAASVWTRIVCQTTQIPLKHSDSEMNILVKPYDKKYEAAVIADISIHFYDYVQLKLKLGPYIFKAEPLKHLTSCRRPYYVPNPGLLTSQIDVWLWNRNVEHVISWCPQMKRNLNFF